MGDINVLGNVTSVASFSAKRKALIAREKQHRSGISSSYSHTQKSNFGQIMGSVVSYRR